MWASGCPRKTSIECRGNEGVSREHMQPPRVSPRRSSPLLLHAVHRLRRLPPPSMDAYLAMAVTMRRWCAPCVHGAPTSPRQQTVKMNIVGCE